MVTTRQQLKVINRIVQFITVDMMDNFICSQFTPKIKLHNMTICSYSLPMKASNVITMAIYKTAFKVWVIFSPHQRIFLSFILGDSSFLRYVIAFPTAKFSSAIIYRVWLCKEKFIACFTRNLDLSSKGHMSACSRAISDLLFFQCQCKNFFANRTFFIDKCSFSGWRMPFKKLSFCISNGIHSLIPPLGILHSL